MNLKTQNFSLVEIDPAPAWANLVKEHKTNKNPLTHNRS